MTRPLYVTPPTDFSAPPDFTQKTILLIDDFQGMRTLLRDLLRACGAKQIDTAASGGEAISLLEKRKYDVVLCDFNLGAGKNGQHLLEEAKVRQLIGPACAWLMITAEKTSDIVMGAAEYQPDGYLIKPITEAVLQARLGKVWAKKAAFLEIDKAIAGKDFLKAIKLCDQRLATDKANAADLLRMKAQLQLDYGETEQARQVFEKVLAERDIPWAKAGLARVLMQSGDDDGARALLESLVSDNRSYLEGYDLLAQLLQQQGELEQAEQLLTRALQLSPHSVQRQKQLGEVALSSGKLELAEKAFRKSMTLGEYSVLKTPAAFLGLSKTLSAQHKPDEAIKTLAGMQKQFSSPELKLRAKIAEGQVYRQSGQADKAQAIAAELQAEAVSSVDKLDSDAMLEMAHLLLAAGDKEGGATLLQSLAKNNHDNKALLERVQDVFEQQGMGEEGARRVAASRQEALEMMNQGVLLVRQGKLREAVDWMRNAKSRLPSNARVLLNYAHVLIVYMQQHGRDPVMQREAHKCLLQANSLSHGEKRFAQLMELLEALPE